MDFVMKQALGGATKDMGKMLGGEEEKDPDAQKKEEERQEALRQQEEERKAKHARMEAEREKVRQQIRDKYGLKKKEEKEAEEKAALEQPCEGSLTRPKKAIPAGSGEHEGMYGRECYHTNVDHGLLGGTQRLWLWVRCPLLELNCLLFFFPSYLGVKQN